MSAHLAARGDDDALSALVRAHHERVFRYGVRVCGGFDAEDAVQEAFIKLSRRPEVMRHEGALAWLMTVVRNTCFRMVGRFVHAAPQLVEEPAPETPDTALERWRLVHEVHAAIATLEPAYREVLVMRDLEGLAGDEVAAALGITSAAMKTRLHRARMTLREKLGRGR